MQASPSSPPPSPIFFFALAPIRARSKFENSTNTRIYRRETLASQANDSGDGGVRGNQDDDDHHNDSGGSVSR